MPTPPTILLIAPHGMLGRAWHELLQNNIQNKGGSPLLLAQRPDFDITDPASIRKHVTNDIDIVINCCAYTDVDGAEEHEAQANAVNGTGVGDLANACRESNALLVHYSTDYVFKGDATEPYPVDAPIEPINAYGRSKALGEKLIRESGCEHLILRTSWLYAPWGKNFVRTIANAAKKRDKLKVVDDQRGRPTSCEHLAKTSMQLIDANARGTFHTTDGGECTWFDFATAIVQQIKTNCTVHPCTTAEYPLPAKRPSYSVFDLSTTEAITGPMDSWQDNLPIVLHERLYINWWELVTERFSANTAADIQDWDQLKKTLKVDQEITGEVLAKSGFGAWIDLGVGYPGLLQIICLENTTPAQYRQDDWCPIGSQVQAKVAGFDDKLQQIRLYQKRPQVESATGICQESQ